MLCTQLHWHYEYVKHNVVCSNSGTPAYTLPGTGTLQGVGIHSQDAYIKAHVLKCTKVLPPVTYFVPFIKTKVLIPKGDV